MTIDAWIVTGATRGLGRALAKQLLDSGAAVAFCARHADTVKIAAADLSSHGSVIGMAGSVADAAFVRRLVERASTLGSLRGVVLNAAVLPHPPLSAVHTLDPSDLRRVLDVNLLGALNVLQATHPYLGAHPSPRILAVTSDASWAAYPGWAGYGISKAALELLVLTYAKENPAILTFVADPGDMDTALHREALPTDATNLRNPDDVATGLMRLLTSPVAQSGRWLIEQGTENYEPREMS
ncbi:MAG: SDR family NAD(P)-dependent oxidoreductase [Thermaerobacter sp.]|nr:SDR family NAD(P)-dependent oxidoreductase [Thermaerobacter sp.]